MIEYRRFESGEADDLVALLCDEEWPFHASNQVAPDDVRRRLAAGYYTGPGSWTFWIIADGAPVGLLRLFDLNDGTPLFDLRLRAAARGHGIGTHAVGWLTSHLFTELPAINRIEATTRQDNHAMRRILRRTGYAKEAHYRQSWPAADRLHDTVGYAVLRHDWESGTVTIPHFDDELCP